MKIRHFKRRTKRPDFRIMRFGSSNLIEVRSASAVNRFFGTTKEDDERAAAFFGQAVL